MRTKAWICNIFLQRFALGSVRRSPGSVLKRASFAAAWRESRFQDSTNELSVTVGKSVLVDTAQPIQRVAMGVGDIAEATAISPTEIMVNGKAPGETSLIIWDIHGGRQFFNVTVRAQQPDEWRHAWTPSGASCGRSCRGKTIRVSLDNGNIFLRGTVNDLISSQRAVEIASAAGKVVNLLDVNVPKSDPQILMKVRFASVDRNKARQLGINLFNLGLGNAVGGVTTGQFSAADDFGRRRRWWQRRRRRLFGQRRHSVVSRKS